MQAASYGVRIYRQYPLIQFIMYRYIIQYETGIPPVVGSIRQGH
eukprot:COSAG06_NODE_15092_length_1098_cov_0.969970_2_plen_43_part_01